VISDHAPWNGLLDELTETFQFRPHFGWVGAIEKHAAVFRA